MFDDLNTRSILSRVPSTLHDEKTRSLWRRIESEYESAGVAGAESYLAAQFDDIRANIKQAVQNLQDTALKPGA
jgi:hypothetical protein